MQEFHGNLLIGGMALKNLDGLIDDDTPDERSDWSGRFTVDRCQRDVLELGRQYLLMLDDGRNREVELTDIVVESAGDAVVCQFKACRPARQAD